jgi:hypothetical protein
MDPDILTSERDGFLADRDPLARREPIESATRCVDTLRPSSAPVR